MAASTSKVEAFLWDRPVPKEWQELLDTFSYGENVSRLVLYWQAGFPDTPVQRWEIYEVQPYNVVARLLDNERGKAALRGDDAREMMMHQIWAHLNGPDPRTIGRWVKNADRGKKWVSKSLVSQAQWRLHQQTGGYPTRVWIIEGQGGGHTWQFGQFERSFLLATGTEPETVQAMAELWPNPGSQPYVDFDERTMTALRERDQLLQWRNSLRWDDRVENAGDLQDFEKARRHEQMALRMSTWLDNQIGDAVSDIPRSMLPAISDYAKVEGADDEDAVIADLIRET